MPVAAAYLSRVDSTDARHLGSRQVRRLGVAEACARVMDEARHVRIDAEAARAFCAAYDGQNQAVPGWDPRLHYFEDTWRSANYVLVLDTLNFCFWASPGEERWTVTYDGKDYQGYWGLAAALRRGIEEGIPLLDAHYLADISRADVARILAGRGEIPLMEARHRNLREAGRWLVTRYDGRFSNMIEQCGYDSVALAAGLCEELSSYHDVATYNQVTVPLLKRAQIVAVDVYGTYGGKRWGELGRLDALTAFADYKVPQVLRRLGVLHYSDALARAVDAQEEIEAGDSREVEIRAATVHAVETVRNTLKERFGKAPRSFEIDWYLWGLGQTKSADDRPYHRTRTIFY
ncbi:MAG: hypothetical protein FJX76_06330 [Armatimonadetes bacterium]|nr:hypothetical protein [Armatimonadota bacterium]